MRTMSRTDNMKPGLDEFVRLWHPGLLVPVQREIPGDLETPVSAFLKLAPRGARFLLESVESGESVGRYSFIGLAPAKELSFTDGQARCLSAEGTSGFPLGEENPLDVLCRELSGYRLAAEPSLPPLLGGAVGYFGYDLIRHFERIPTRPLLDGEIPEAVFLLTHTLVVFDHVKRTTRVIALAEGDGDARHSYAAATAKIQQTLDALAGAVPQQPALRQASRLGRSTSNLTQAEFEKLVLRAQDYIRAGDIFQVVLSQRFSGETFASPFQVYRALRMLNPSPYMFFLDLGSFQLVGSSPEALVKLAHGVAAVRPIAGTRPRGANETEDKALAEELLGDDKERAEHVMLVDLGRNDLGRVCRYGTVRVSEFMEVERYSHVMHLVSNVSGSLSPSADMYGLFRAAFPAGTVTGAPKVRAMEIIAELEPEPRGPYAGAVGYFGFGGNLDTCIAIRTILLKNGRFWLQGGAGIVADSHPTREYQETISKMEALRRALELAEEGW